MLTRTVSLGLSLTGAETGTLAVESVSSTTQRASLSDQRMHTQGMAMCRKKSPHSCFLCSLADPPSTVTLSTWVDARITRPVGVWVSITHTQTEPFGVFEAV